MDIRHFFVTFLFIVGAWAVKNSDEVREFIYDNRDNKSVLNEEPAPPWVSSPNVRGTGDIIISCLVTLIACAYTAIHPTVPPGGSGKRSFMFIKTALVFVAALGPEAVFALAFQEYLDARRLKRKLKKIIIDQDKDNHYGGCKKCEKCKALKTVDMKFCYFVVMGGLQVDISDIKPSDHVRLHFHGDKMPEKLPLSADGVIELAMLGYLDKLLVEHTVIEDKSKAALVQKCVVLIQVAWMGIQCIARKSAGYPVSLLELHTFGHVLVAMLLYLCWLRKPLDVRQPVFIEPTEFKDEQATQGFQDALALMVQEQFCDLQNVTGILDLWSNTGNIDVQNSLSEGNRQNLVKQEEAQIVINQMADESTPQPTPAHRAQHVIRSEQSMANPQEPTMSVSIKEVGQNGDLETLDLKAGGYLPCRFGHLPMTQKPTWSCIFNGKNDVRRNLKRELDLYRSQSRRWEDNLPIRLTRTDRRRAERAARHIKFLDGQCKQEQPEPYAYQRNGSTGQYYRYVDRGYRTAFQSLKFEVDKLNPFAKKKGKSQHFWDRERANPEIIDVHRRGLCERSCPRLIEQYAAFLDAMFNGISEGSRVACTILSILIGAIHLAAWDSVFPGRVESIMWKVASVAMMTTVPAVLLYRLQVVLIQRYLFQYYRQGYETSHVWFTWIVNVWYFILAIVVLVFFVCVRCYLIIESLISVRHMAYGVYFVPDWLQIFPHI